MYRAGVHLRTQLLHRQGVEFRVQYSCAVTEKRGVAQGVLLCSRVPHLQFNAQTLDTELNNMSTIFQPLVCGKCNSG